MRCFSIFCVVLAAVTFTSGCSQSDRPKLAPVTGLVLLDNEPVAEAAVMFVPVAGGRPAQGLTDAQGKFRLTTFDENDGAIVGDHKVGITKVKVSGATETSDGLSGSVDASQIQETWIVPQKYSQPDGSGLTAKVEKGMAEPKFELSTK